jgi:hypothetical protein
MDTLSLFYTQPSNLDNNIILIPICMLMMNITGRVLPKIIPDSMFHFVTQPVLQPFIFFFLFYVATRRFFISLSFSVIVYYIITLLLNENSEYSLIPKVKTDEENPLENKSELYFKNKMNTIQSNISNVYKKLT